MMSPMEFSVNFFVALFALIDPVGNVPLFAAATSGASAAARRLTSLYIAAFALGFLTFFYLTGVALLQFFGISLPAFRIAYKPDSRQQIADSWPKSLDDARAQGDWGWKARVGVEQMVADMLENVDVGVTA